MAWSRSDHAPEHRQSAFSAGADRIVGDADPDNGDDLAVFQDHDASAHAVRGWQAQSGTGDDTVNVHHHAAHVWVFRAVIFGRAVDLFHRVQYRADRAVCADGTGELRESLWAQCAARDCDDAGGEGDSRKCWKSP